MYATKNKPMTLKEFKKNFFKLLNIQSNDKEKEELNRSQNILLQKILKNRKINHNISIDTNINNTNENIFRKEENKRKDGNGLNKKKRIKTNISHDLSPEKTPEPGESPKFFMGNSIKYSFQKNSELISPNKSFNYNNLNTYNKKRKNKHLHINSYFTNKNHQNKKSKKISESHNKALTPLANHRNKIIFDKCLDDKIEENKDKKLDSKAHKNKDNKNHLFHHNHTNMTKKNNTKKEISPTKNIKNNIKKDNKDNKDNNNNINLKKKDKMKKKDYLTISNISIENQSEINILSKNNNLINYTDTNINIDKKNIPKSLSNDINRIDISDLNIKKEFTNLQIKNIIFFDLKCSYIKQDINKPKIEKKETKLFKQLKQEKSAEIFIKNQKVIKAINNKEKNNNIIKDQYTGYILVQKKLGNIEKETKLDKNIEEIKSIFLNILNDMQENKLEYILTNELITLKSEINKNIDIINELNKEKSEYILKDKKIEEQEEIIQKRDEEYFLYQQEYLKLQSEYEKMKLENEEKIKLLENENKNITEEYTKLKEENLKYKNNKDIKINNEIKDLEGKIKIYKEELKNKKYNFNIGNINLYKRRKSVTYNFKYDALLNNLEKKKNKEKAKFSSKNIRMAFTIKKKTLEDIEDKEEKEEGIEEDNKKKESKENKVKDENKQTIENKTSLKNEESQENKINNENDINDKIKVNLNENIIATENKINNNNSKEEDLNKGNNLQNNLESKDINLTQKNNIPSNNNNMNDNKNNNIINSKNSNDVKDDKQKKMNKALNRFKKRVSQTPDLVQKKYNRRSSIKKSEKIRRIAKMLEDQIGKSEEKREKTDINDNNRPKTDDEADMGLNIVELIERKPAAVSKKRKPTLKNKIF